MKKILMLSNIIALLSSCSMGKLTTHQQQELLEIDKQMNKLWTDYEYQVDSLWIERDKIINNLKK